MLEEIAEMLAKGIQAARIAEVCGCSVQYISELVKESEKFKELLKEKMAKYAEERIDNRFKQLEEKTINEISSNIATAEIRDQIRVLESIARIKAVNKNIIPPGSYLHPTTHISLHFQEGNIPKLVTDESNRVIAIGNQTVIPMPSAGVRKLFEQMDQKGKVIEKGTDNGNLTIKQETDAAAAQTPVAAAN